MLHDMRKARKHIIVFWARVGPQKACESGMGTDDLLRGAATHLRTPWVNTGTKGIRTNQMVAN